MRLKVITAPTMTDLVSDADLRTHLRIASDGSEDGLMVAYRLAAHKMAEHYANYPIGSQVLELALDGFPDDAIRLRGKVTALTSVKYMDADEVEQTVSSTNYTLDDYGIPCWVVPAVDYTWPTTLDAANSVKVRFTAGDAPDAVKSALLIIIGNLYEHRGDEAQDIPQAAKALLDTVRQWDYA